MKVLKLLCITLAVVCLSSIANATRPCGQAEPCPAIELEGPIPNPWPADDPNANWHLVGTGSATGPYPVEEFFVSGTTNVFNYHQPDALIGEQAGDNLVVRYGEMAYKTRIIVRRPPTGDRFNGTVVIEFMNSTAGYDVQPTWRHSADFFRKRGIVYIGATTSGNQSIPFLTGGCKGGLSESCGSRYQDLSIDDNGQEYEIVSQLASALKSNYANQRLLPEDFGPVRRVYIAGYSQQGGSVNTMASQFHQPDIDGYFSQAYGWAREISGNIDITSGSANDPQLCSHPDSEPYPDCVASLAEGQPAVRTNLPVPVYQAMSETDAVFIGGIANRQEDTDTSAYASYRLVEVPGSSHVYRIPGELFPGYTLDELCLFKPYYLDYPVGAVDVYNAYWQAMFEQVEHGVLPPYAPRISTDESGAIIRDQYGNAMGGVRLPEYEYARASYFSPLNSLKPVCDEQNSEPDCLPLPPALGLVLNLACLLTGAQQPFTDQEMKERYPSAGRYIRGYSDHTLKMAKDRMLLREDARARLTGILQDWR